MKVRRTGSDTQMGDGSLCKFNDCIDVDKAVGETLLARGGWSEVTTAKAKPKAKPSPKPRGGN